MHHVRKYPNLRGMNNLAPFPDLLSAIEAHCAKTGMRDSAFGHVALGDPNFVRNLRDGREPRRRTASRAIEYILTGITWEEAKAKAMSDNSSVDALPDVLPPVADNDAGNPAIVSPAENHTGGEA